MAMPPNAPMPPQDNAAEDAQDGGADDAQEQAGGASGKELIVSVHSGLAKVVQLASKAGAPEDVVAELQSSLDSFRSAIEKLMGGASGPKPASNGSASPEQGGNPNAVPMP